MRPVERIVPFINKIDFKRLFDEVWPNLGVNSTQMEITIIHNLHALIRFWLDNQDLRFSQVIVNMGLLPNVPGLWYYMEDSEILEKLGEEPAEVNYWGSLFDENGDRRDEIYWSKISNLKTNHIARILEGGYVERNPKYKRIMEKELEARANEIEDGF
jgi:hypothetical protein